MCIIAIQFYESCGHNSRDHPDRCIDLVDSYCTMRLGTSCPAHTETEEHHEGAECEKCSGSHIPPINDWTLGQYYKYCEQSSICDHEYGHLVTDLERLDNEPDIVLVTPTYILCPDCQASSLHSRPRNPLFDTSTKTNTSSGPISTKSSMPADFEGLPRISIHDFEEDRDIKKVSIVPNPTVRPSEQTVFSRAVTGTYNPSASRVPADVRRTATTMRYRIGSQMPAPLYPVCSSPSRLVDTTLMPAANNTTTSMRTTIRGTTSTRPEVSTSLAPDSASYTHTRAPPAEVESMDLTSMFSNLSTAPLPTTSHTPMPSESPHPRALRAQTSLPSDKSLPTDRSKPVSASATPRARMGRYPRKAVSAVPEREESDEEPGPRKRRA